MLNIFFPYVCPYCRRCYAAEPLTVSKTDPSPHIYDVSLQHSTVPFYSLNIPQNTFIHPSVENQHCFLLVALVDFSFVFAFFRGDKETTR
jgi:hypothetical protein